MRMIVWYGIDYENLKLAEKRIMIMMLKKDGIKKNSGNN